VFERSGKASADYRVGSPGGSVGLLCVNSEPLSRKAGNADSVAFALAKLCLDLPS
jgi:hypothetical protein